MVIPQGEVWWAELGLPFRGGVVVVQGAALSRSRIATVGCVSLTSNLALADAPGNVLLLRRKNRTTKRFCSEHFASRHARQNCARRQSREALACKTELLLAGLDVVLIVLGS